MDKREILRIIRAISIGCCWYCGRHEDACGQLVVDHVVPRAKGGKDGLNNSAAACWDCNSKKAHRSLAYMRQRLGSLAGETYGWFKEGLRLS